MKKQWKVALVVAVVAVVGILPAVLAGQGSSMVEWPYVGGDQAHQKYSSLADIDASNVQELEQVWSWEHGETPLVEYETRPDAFEVAPLMIDNTLYLSTPYNPGGSARRGDGRGQVAVQSGGVQGRPGSLSSSRRVVLARR